MRWILMRWILMRWILMRWILAACLSPAPAPAALAGEPAWRDVVSDYDAERLGGMNTAYLQALSAVLEGAAVEDRLAFDQATTPAVAIDADGAEGRWRCRVMKLGGLLPLVVYDWFDCRITRQGGLLRFEKLSGSQRTNGLIYPDAADRMIYLGAKTYGYETTTRRYSGPDGALRDTPDNRDTPGVLHQRGPDHLTIGFPRPVVESIYDILELRR